MTAPISATRGHLLASRAYAAGLAGEPAVVEVPAWGSHVVKRALPRGLEDVAGIYPLAVFGSPYDLSAGLEQLAAAGFVSAVMVPDPLLTDAGQLAGAFPVFRPYKTHHLIDPARGPFEPSKHHRYEIRRGLRNCAVELVPLEAHLDDWRALYAGLVQRRSITSVADFSDGYFRALAASAPITAFLARAEGACVGMALWFAADGVVYNHLNAANALGYASGAKFARYDAAIAHFWGAGVINLGGGVGLGDGDDGLASFKRGFANASVQSCLCGRVLDPSNYAALSGGQSDQGYFPAYRAPQAAHD